MCASGRYKAGGETGLVKRYEKLVQDDCRKVRKGGVVKNWMRKDAVVRNCAVKN